MDAKRAIIVVFLRKQQNSQPIHARGNSGNLRSAPESYAVVVVHGGGGGGGCGCGVISETETKKSRKLPCSSLHDDAFPAAGRLAWVLRLFDFADHELEGVLDIGVVARAGLGPGAIELFAQLLAFFFGDLSPVGLEVAFVSDED